MEKHIEIENKNIVFLTIKYDYSTVVCEYMRISANNWLVFYDGIWEDYSSSEEIEEIYQNYKK